LHATASAVFDALVGLDDWGLAGTRQGQYRSDLAADAVAVEIVATAVTAGNEPLRGKSSVQQAVCVFKVAA
ncbi:MAG: hypothetical protein WA639_08100, partial [Candidatus Acidiferrum sp.]